MKEERDKLRDLLNSNIPMNMELGMTLMQTVGVPSGVNWNTHHLFWFGDWLEALPSGMLKAEDIEDKEISCVFWKTTYKICFYEMDLRIREFHFVNGTTLTLWNKIGILLKEVQHATFVKSLYWGFRSIVFEWTKLITLRLEDTYLADLSKKISQLSSIKELYLRNCWIEFLPQDIGNLKQLEILDIRRNRLRVLPSSFWELVQLKILYLGDIIRWEEPKTDILLEQLEVLELNKTQHVPDWVWQRMPNLKRLTWIKTSGITVVELSENIGTLKNLECLILYVRTVKYPVSIANLSKLRILKIYNEIPQAFFSLPAEWSRLSGLKVLKIRGVFDRLPMEWAAMEQLEEFWLNNMAEIIVPLVYEFKNLRKLLLFVGKNTLIDSKITTLVHLKLLLLKTSLKESYYYNYVVQQKRKVHLLLPKLKIKI